MDIGRPHKVRFSFVARCGPHRNRGCRATNGSFWMLHHCVCRARHRRNGETQEIGRWANNRGRDLHLPFRRRERVKLRFRKIRSCRSSALSTLRPQSLQPGSPPHHQRDIPTLSRSGLVEHARQIGVVPQPYQRPLATNSRWTDSNPTKVAKAPALTSVDIECCPHPTAAFSSHCCGILPAAQEWPSLDLPKVSLPHSSTFRNAACLPRCRWVVGRGFCRDIRDRGPDYWDTLRRWIGLHRHARAYHK